MIDLRDLYQEVILDHNRNPRNYHDMIDATTKAVGNNPLCGDQLTLFLKIAEGSIQDASFVGRGCAISTASASLMTDSVKGRTVAEAEKMFQQFHDMLTTSGSACQMDKLSVLSGVKEFPVRVKCATLAWHTLQAALHHVQTPVTTEVEEDVGIKT